jgi:hypothetical protein
MHMISVRVLSAILCSPVGVRENILIRPAPLFPPHSVDEHTQHLRAHHLLRLLHDAAIEDDEVGGQPDGDRTELALASACVGR